MIGIVLGNRYEILEEIGKGGMAHVYKAKCNLLNRPVAIKVLRQDLEEDSEFLKRFNTEAQSAASLVHPNIVSIFDFGYDQGYHYIVMELIEGITLKQYIQENAPFEVKDALSVAYQICDALSAAHEKNIIHRDIKPHNIMITPEHRVKVTDFGIARVSSGSTMTADTNILGSVHYISPEQARGGHVDGKTDLYSLGIVIYEMLTGRIPFESDSPVAIAMKHIQETPISPREYNPEISQSVENMILKSLSKNISERYQNANDMKKDIMRLMDNPDAQIGTKVSFGDADADDTMIISKNEILKAEEKMGQRSQNVSVKKEPSSSNENKKILISAILTAFVIVGSISLFAAYILFPEAGIFSIFQSEQVVVPEFINMHLDEAKELAQSENVEIEIGDEVEDSSVPEGVILEQSPNARKKVKPGSVISVTVSVGAEKILIDDFKSSKFDVAEAVLEDLGFFVDVTYENSEDTPEDYVIRHNPPAGQKAAKGSTVTLVVSKGPEETEVVVPRFVGKTYEQAKKDIEDASLALGEVTYEESVIDKGLVIKQSITGGETVNKGTSVDLVVSLGNGDKTDVGNHGTGQNNHMVEKTLVSKIHSDKDEVIIKVLEDGNKIYEGLFEPKVSSEFSLKVSGTGQKNYEVYVDGELVNTYTISFN